MINVICFIPESLPPFNLHSFLRRVGSTTRQSLTQRGRDPSSSGNKPFANSRYAALVSQSATQYLYCFLPSTGGCLPSILSIHEVVPLLSCLLLFALGILSRTRQSAHDLAALVEALLLARLLSSESSLPEVLIRSATLLAGAEYGMEVQQSIKQGSTRVPHKTQLSRARIKLDMLLMLIRQDMLASSGEFLFLSADASPIGGKEYFLVIEDKVRRKDAASLVGADLGALQAFSFNKSLETSSLPVTILGSGAASAASKAECLAHVCLLDTAQNGDPLLTKRYACSIVCLCTDFGAEGHLTAMPAVDLRDLQRVSVRESNGLLTDDGVGASQPSDFLSLDQAGQDGALVSIPGGGVIDSFLVLGLEIYIFWLVTSDG